MGKPKGKAASKKRVAKKEEKVEDEPRDSTHEESPEDDKVVDKKRVKNGNPENTDDGKEEVKARTSGRGKGKPAQGKKATSTPTPKAAVAKGKKREAAKPVVPSKKAKSKEPEPTSEEDDDQEYEVEKILNVRFKKGGKREFQIQWKGYGPKEATWEPEENLECQDLLDAFLAKADDNDLSRARRVSSRPSTIRSTRISETRVRVGRISKANTSKVVKVENNSLLDRFQRLNGQALGNKIVKQNDPRDGNVNIRRPGGRGMMRAALLSCGMAISVGAALLLSSSSTINWDGLQDDIYQYIHSLRDKLGQ